MTVELLAQETGLTTSLIDGMEAGVTTPSTGSLILIASALRVPTSDLFAEVGGRESQRVVRLEEQPVAPTWPGVSRRIVKTDRLRHIEISVNEWEETGGGELHRHVGFEYGLILEGSLSVEVDNQTYELQPGDIISYSSAELHNMWNSGPGVARAVWVNLDSFTAIT